MSQANEVTTKPKPFKIKNKRYKSTDDYYNHMLEIKALPAAIKKQDIDTALFTWVVQYGSSAVERTQENSDRVSVLWGQWYGANKYKSYQLLRKVHDAEPFDDRFMLTPTGKKYFALLCSEGGESNE